MENSLYTEEEFNRLKQILSRITSHIPTELATEVWNNYKRISKSNENQPCNCGSSAGLWRKAVDTIHNYVNSNS
jgi:hypothetical protein